MSDDAAALRQLLAGLAESEAKDADLLLLDLDPTVAHRLELCAIPHSFNSAMLPVLDPSITPDAVAEFINEIRLLPAITPLQDDLIIHDIVREQLFHRWLGADRRDEFSQASSRLVQYYTGILEHNPRDEESLRGTIMFHRMGADPPAGFQNFRDLYRRFRTLSLYSMCEFLVRLISEYLPILGEVEKAWLEFFEAETAADARNFEKSITLLTQLVMRQLPPELGVLARTSLSAALRQQSRVRQAAHYAGEALKLAGRARGDRDTLYAAYVEQGRVFRELGDLDRAEEFLRDAVDIASQQGNRVAAASAYNSLGMAFDKIAPDRAIDMYEASVRELDAIGDQVRLAQVLNNLGLAYANAAEWDRSHQSLTRSLEIKRAGGDLYGQAVTQLNLSRVYRAQSKAFAARSALGEAAALFEATNNRADAATARAELARMNGQGDATDGGTGRAGGGSRHRRFPAWAWVLAIIALLLILLYASLELE